MPLEELVERGGVWEALGSVSARVRRSETWGTGRQAADGVAFAEAFVAAGVGMAEDAGEEADGGVEDDRGG